MKTIFNLIFSLFSIWAVQAQSSIHYKAIITDGNGNIVANTLIVVQFTILEDATNVYQENHTPTTDENGLVIINIGEGTTISGVFSEIAWNQDDHFLNVQVNTGGGLVDLGTTQFLSVPYSIHSDIASEALNVTGLEALDQGEGIGWRLIGRDPARYGAIDENAVDFSNNVFITGTGGATGQNSFAAGYNTEASSIYATVFGTGSVASGSSSFAANSNTTASGSSSTAFGLNSVASGTRTFAAGRSVLAEAYQSFAFGNYSLGGGNPTGNVLTDPLFVIGNGASQIARANAFTLLKNGNLGIGVDFPIARLQIDGRFQYGSVEFIEDSGSLRTTIESSLLPNSDGVYNLGSGALRWENLFVFNGAVNTSDRRDKSNIASMEYGLNEVLQLKPVSFNWKKDTSRHGGQAEEKKLGLIAQDLLNVIPEVVKTHDWEFVNEDRSKRKKVALDRLGVYYSDLIPVLIKAIQEQQDMIEDQRATILVEKEKVKVLQTQLLRFQDLATRIQVLENDKIKTIR